MQGIIGRVNLVLITKKDFDRKGENCICYGDERLFVMTLFLIMFNMSD